MRRLGSAEGIEATAVCDVASLTSSGNLYHAAARVAAMDFVG